MLSGICRLSILRLEKGDKVKYPCFLPIMVGLMSFTSDVIASDPSVELLASIDGETGAAAARSAVQKLSSGGAANLMSVLNGFQDATPLGANWLRNAFETIAAGETAAGRDLPAEQLTRFIQDTANAPVARRLVYEWLLRQDETLEQRLIPGFLEDVHPDFRRDAVALLIARATSVQNDLAVPLYRMALRGAVHDDQVKVIAEALETVGQPVNLQKHFGFLSAWKIVGPFDNRQMNGFAAAYGPETDPDLKSDYDGQLGPVSWQDISTDDSYGIVNIAQQIENYKGSLMYAATTFHSTDEREIEFRLGTPNAWKLWVNGELIFEREEYHRGTRMDQYRIPVSLGAGENTIMLKVCQNEQEQDWAQRYQFQLRVVDSSGAAVLSSGENHEQ